MTKQELKQIVKEWKELALEAMERGDEKTADKCLKMSIDAWKLLQAKE